MRVLIQKQPAGTRQLARERAVVMPAVIGSFGRLVNKSRLFQASDVNVCITGFIDWATYCAK